jgi:hypothetical protein
MLDSEICVTVDTGNCLALGANQALIMVCLNKLCRNKMLYDCIIKGNPYHGYAELGVCYED